MDLKSARKLRNLNQTQLGNITGLSQIEISNIEIGKVRPWLETKRKIEGFLKLPINWDQTYFQHKAINYQLLFTLLDALFEMDETSREFIINYAKKYTLATKLDVRDWKQNY